MEGNRLLVGRRFCAGQLSGVAKRDATIASIAPEIWQVQRYEKPSHVAKFYCCHCRLILVIRLYLYRFHPSCTVDDDRR